MRRIFRPLPRLPLRAAGPLTVSVITPFPPCSLIPGSVNQHRLVAPDGGSWRSIGFCHGAGGSTEAAVAPTSPARHGVLRVLPAVSRLARVTAPGPRPLAVVRAMDLVVRVAVVRVAGIRQAPIAQFGDGLLEVIERLEAPVHAGKPEVGDLVKVAERPEDRKPHLVGWHFRQAARPDRLLDPLGEDGELALVDRTALAGALHSPDDLVSGERLGHPAALGHHEDDRLLRGEPPPAFGAGPPPPDRGAVVGHPAVDNPAVRMTAERTVHALPLQECLVVPIPLRNIHNF